MKTKSINSIYWCILASVLMCFSSSIDFLSIKFGSYRLSIFRILTIVLLGMFMLSILKRDYKLTRLMRYYIVSFSILIILQMLSLIWVEDFGAWIKSIYFWGIIYLYILIFGFTLKKSKWYITLLKIFSIIFFICILFAWGEVFFKWYFFNSRPFIEEYKKLKLGIPIVCFGNTNDFSLAMSFSIFNNLACFNLENKRIKKFYYIFSIVSALLLVFISSSRACMIGIFLGIIVYAYLKGCFKFNRKISIILLYVILVGILFNIEKIINYITKILFALDLNADYMSSGKIRINLIKNAIEFLKNTAGLGVGAGNIEYWMKNYAIYDINNIYNVHNWWFEILLTGGILSFLIYVIFYCNILYKSYKSSYVRNNRDSIISQSFCAIIVMFIVASISSSSNLSSEWLWVYWAMIISFVGNYKIIDKTIDIK